MINSLGLSSAQLQLLKTITQQLSEIPGIVAIVLGGSYVRGTARPDSDLDIGIYYSEQSPPEIEAIRNFARKVSIPQHSPTVTGFYEWGPWVNGGAWIQTVAGKVDLLYRNVEQVERVLKESQTGIYHHHFYQQPTFGFVSVVYLAETKCCLPLFDRQHLLSQFKRRVEIYPSPLQVRLTKDCLSMAEFTFIHAFGFAQRGDIFNAVGCLTRIAFIARSSPVRLERRLLLRRQRLPGSHQKICAPTESVFQTPGRGTSTPDGQPRRAGIRRSTNADSLAGSRRSN
jgi:hypothetical protein